MNGVHFLTLIRWPNMTLVMMMQIVMFYGYVVPYCTPDPGQKSSFIILVLATGAILAGGNIFNDIHDIPVDHLHPRKNKVLGSEIPISIAWKLYFGLNIVALTGVAVMGIVGWNLLLTGIFPLVFVLLIFYSLKLKNSILWGNILIALLCALAVYITSLVTPSCSLDSSFQPEERVSVIFHGYIINAFLILLIREILKDKEDYPTDQKFGIRTVGILTYSQFTLLFYSLVLTALAINAYGMYLLYPHLSAFQWMAGLLILFPPLIYIGIKYPESYKKNYFRRLSRYMKIYILLALFLLFIWM